MKSTTTLWRGYLFVVMIWQLLVPVTSLILGQSPRCNSQCVYEYIPVCGNDGRTYPNVCFLFVASCRNISLTLVRGGPCVVPDPCEIVCNRRYDPVCGSDGVTYSNPCVLMYASCYYVGRGITTLHFGRCTPPPPAAPTPTRPPCPFGCTREYVPVCGSDGITYPNQCNFNMVACRKEDIITKVKNGPCGEDPTLVLTPAPSRAPTPTRPRAPTPTRPPCPFGCTREYVPVCGSDGMTYPNQCNLNMIACRKVDIITKVKNGPCDQQLIPATQPRCPLGCNKVYEPLCGSDGITYTNLCVFTKTTCKDPSITKRKNGPCESPPNTTPRGNEFIPTTIPSTNNVPNRDFCRKDCPFTYDPLCGTDDVTYTNKCTFDVAVCRNVTLKVRYNESCN